MQYISDDLKFKTIKINDFDTTEVFESLIKSVEEAECDAIPTSIEDTLALALFSSKCVTPEFFKNLDISIINNTTDNMVRLMNNFEDAGKYSSDEFETIPYGFEKLFNIEKGASYVKSLEACKPTKRKVMVRNKRRMFI